MTIRIRVQLGPDFERTLARQRQIASILAAFLTPVAVSAFLLCVWRLGSISDGPANSQFPTGCYLIGKSGSLLLACCKPLQLL